MYTPQSHSLSKPVRELKMQLQKEGGTEISQPKASWIFSCQGLGISKRPERILHSPKHFRFSTDNSYRWGRKAERNPSKAFQAEQSLHKCPKACGWTRKQRELSNNVQSCQLSCKSERDLSWRGKLVESMNKFGESW